MYINIVLVYNQPSFISYCPRYTRVSRVGSSYRRGMSSSDYSSKVSDGGGKVAEAGGARSSLVGSALGGEDALKDLDDVDFDDDWNSYPGAHGGVERPPLLNVMTTSTNGDSPHLFRCTFIFINAVTVRACESLMRIKGADLKKIIE